MKRVDLNKIKFLRKQAILSVEEMAQKLGYESSNGYYYLEVGRGKFSAEALARVADILKVPIDELFFVEKVTEKVITKSEHEQSPTNEFSHQKPPNIIIAKIGSRVVEEKKLERSSSQ